MVRLIRIREHERGLKSRHGDFVAVLRPGLHALVPLVDDVLVLDTLATKIEHPRLEVLLRHAAFSVEVDVVELGDAERAVVKRDGRVAWVLGPGRHAFWREPYRVEVERHDAGRLRFEHKRLDAVLAAPGARAHLAEVPVPADHEVLVFHDGRLAHRVIEGVASGAKGAA